MGIAPLYFSVNKWNRFHDTSGPQKKLVWLNCGGGGGGERGMYVAHGLKGNAFGHKQRDIQKAHILHISSFYRF